LAGLVRGPFTVDLSGSSLPVTILMDKVTEIEFTEDVSVTGYIPPQPGGSCDDVIMEMPESMDPGDPDEGGGGGYIDPFGDDGGGGGGDGPPDPAQGDDVPDCTLECATVRLGAGYRGGPCTWVGPPAGSVPSGQLQGTHPGSELCWVTEERCRYIAGNNLPCPEPPAPTRGTECDCLPIIGPQGGGEDSPEVPPNDDEPTPGEVEPPEECSEDYLGPQSRSAACCVGYVCYSRFSREVRCCDPDTGTFGPMTMHTWFEADPSANCGWCAPGSNQCPAGIETNSNPCGTVLV